MRSEASDPSGMGPGESHGPLPPPSSTTSPTVSTSGKSTKKKKKSGKLKKPPTASGQPSVPKPSSTELTASSEAVAAVAHALVTGPQRPPLCEPRLFPAMAALDLCGQRNSANQSKAALLTELQEEKAARVLLLLQAFWYPSTNKSFELLAGKAGRYTYFLFARNEKVVCEDLYGAFCAIYKPGAEQTRRTSELIALVPLPKDVAVYAWDLGSLMTQASYFLTFVSSTGFPASVVSPYRQRVEELLAFPELARGELPSMEHLSEVLSKITFEGGCRAHAILSQAAAKLAPGARLAVEPLLGEEGQEKCFSTPPGPPTDPGSRTGEPAQLLVADDTMSENLRNAIAVHNLIVEASQRLSRGELSCSLHALQWHMLDEALCELMEHVILCGLSYLSHLKMTRSIPPGPLDTIYTQRCISQTVIRLNGVMEPPPMSDSLRAILESNAPFEALVMHPHLDNEHVIHPDALRQYIRGGNIGDMLSHISTAIDTYTDRPTPKQVA